jgi:5-methylcytosine-specific restriction protein A
MRREFPKSVRVEALKRCQDDKGIPRCEGCGAALKAGAFAFDHRNPDALTGEPTLSNCQVLCTVVCHPEKTRSDVAVIAKAKRREADHLGVRNTPSRPIGRRPRKLPKNPASAPLNKWFGPGMERRP